MGRGIASAQLSPPSFLLQGIRWRRYFVALFSINSNLVPWDITEEALVEAFCPYGVCRVEWPGKEARGRTLSRGGQRKVQLT